MEKTPLQSLCLTIAVLVSAGTLQATPISIEFGGVITQFGYSNIRPPDIVWPDFTPGDAFTVIVNYDDANSIGGINGRYWGGVDPAMIVTCGDVQFTIAGAMRWGIGDSVSDYFTAWWQGADARFVTPWTEDLIWGRAALNLYDLTGEKSFLAYGGNGYGQFEMRGEITSAGGVPSRVPETLSTGLALAGVSLLMLMGRHLRPPRPAPAP